jgi:hypothetical protein
VAVVAGRKVAAAAVGDGGERAKIRTSLMLRQSNHRSSRHEPSLCF